MGERASGLIRRAGVWKRRGVLAGAMAALGAGLARLGAPERARAAHVMSDEAFIHAGVDNTTTSTTIIRRTGSDPALAAAVGPIQSGIGPDGLQGFTDSTTDGIAGVRGYAQASSGQVHGVIGRTLSGALNASGVRGTASSGTTNGVWGENSSTTSTATGAYGLASGGGTAATVGVWGRSTSSGAGAIGTFGEIQSGTGTGVLGSSANGTGVKGASTNGVGAIGTSTGNIGVYGASTNNVGVFGDAGQNTAVMGRTGNGIGVYGTATNPGGGGRAAVFDGTVLINGPFTVTAGFPKSAAVKHPDGSQRRMYCQESPEPWFEDFGTATLTKGRAEITLDPDFDAVVKGDDYLVFLTPYGQCNGLCVVRRGPHRFVVEELGKGTSNVELGYRVVARRLDDVGKRMEKVDVRPAQSRDFKPPALHGPVVPSRP